jgi:hypothetical protein
MREYKKGKWDIIMDWETNKLCVYDSKKVAYNSLKQYKKYYPDDGSKIVVGIFKY